MNNCKVLKKQIFDTKINNKKLNVFEQLVYKVVEISAIRC